MRSLYEDHGMNACFITKIIRQISIKFGNDCLLQEEIKFGGCLSRFSSEYFSRLLWNLRSHDPANLKAVRYNIPNFEFSSCFDGREIALLF